MITTIEEVEVFLALNPNHPEYSSINGELQLLQTYKTNLHDHNSIESAIAWYESMPHELQLGVLIDARRLWVEEYPHTPFSIREGMLLFVRKLMDEEREINGENAFFDENYDCPRDREYKALMQQSFEHINHLINHGKEHRPNQRNAIKADSKGGIS